MPETPERDNPPAMVASRPVGLRIGNWWRAVAITLGLAGLGSGATAVFITHLEAGPVALLAVGLVLLLVGIGGQLPSRLRMGDSEAAWEAVETFAERVAIEAPPAIQPEMMDALTDLAAAAPQAAAPALSSMAYKSEVLRMLEEVAPLIPASLVREGQVLTTVWGDPEIVLWTRPEAVVETPAGLRIAVEVAGTAKYVKRGTVEQFRSWLSVKASATEPAGVASGVLLITREPLDRVTRSEFDHLPGPAVWVNVRGQQDKQRVTSALREVVNLAQARQNVGNTPPEPAVDGS
jgi:hypothetical protein